MLSFIPPQTYIVDRYQKKVVIVASVKNSSLENAGESAHHSGVCQKLVKAALGPIENLEIVTNQAKDPPIVDRIRIMPEYIFPIKGLDPESTKRVIPIRIKNKGNIYLGVICASFTSG